jgi:circadian clock protein KaiC
MAQLTNRRNGLTDFLPKVPTGIQGLDEITGGGLPQGRPTLVCGSAGCGKTLLAMEFLVRGAMQYREPGVFMAFEETADELTQNVRSLGFDVQDLVKRKKLALDYVRVERREIEETGDYDLEGLFVRLNHAIDTIGAKRVVLDTIETLFSGLSNLAVLRAELRRLFRWLKDKGVTAVITGERGTGQLTRHGLEEYVSDCVILLDHRVIDQVSTRRVRIVKYRGTTHGTNEYPFLIDEHGISVLPITSLSLQHPASNERVSTGIQGLDEMLGGAGYFRGSSILISGTAGTGKTSVAAQFALAACQRGEKCFYLAFEESPSQIVRNMRSIGLNLTPWIKKGLFQFHATRPTVYGMEMHLVMFHKLLLEFQPRVVVFDPIGSLTQAGNRKDATAMVTRLLDFLKGQRITTLLTNLTSGDEALETTDVDISSTVDTWLLLRDIELGGERNRALYILKSRGMAHSNQVREFLLTNRGIQLQDVYLSANGILTGSARQSHELREKAALLLREERAAGQEREWARKRVELDDRIAVMRKQFESDAQEARWTREQKHKRIQALQADQQQLGLSRQAPHAGKPVRSRAGRVPSRKEST